MKCLLGEIAEVTMGQSPKSEYYNNDGNGIPFLQGNRTFGRRYPSFDTYTTLATKMAKAGDVIMSVRAPVGDLNFTPVDMCLGRGVCSIRMNNGNQDYLYYLLKYNMPLLLNKESGTVFGSVNRNDIIGLEIEIEEDANKQREIARYLSMLDDKIEENEEINSNLEQQAQAIFKSWFVNFENLDESIVGSWELQKLGNIACFSQGTQVPIEDQLFVPTEGYTRFIRIIDVTQPSNQDIRYIKDTKKGKVTSSDIFMIRYGTPGIVARNYAGIIANNLFKITPTTEKVTSNYLYHFLKSSDVQNYITQNAVSSTMPAINFSTLKNLEIIIPDDMTMKKFSSLSEAIRVKQLELSKENLHLSSIRDTLLPKLMSGEIDLSSIDI